MTRNREVLTMQAAVAVDKAIAEIADFDLKIEGATQGMPSIHSESGPASYVARHRHEYMRTVSDVQQYRPPSPGPVRVLELGAFFGVNCMALRSLGYEVTAADMPEFIDNPAQITRYARHGIATKGVRLEEFALPFDDDSFDIIIMCEVLEHLNFNPLPLIKEINRIGSPKSIFYLSLPNVAQIRNRIKALRGKALGISVAEFFTQLDPQSSEIVNGHWREYTGPEIREMLERLGYRIEKQYYFSLGETLQSSTLRRKAARLFYGKFPWFKENQTTIAIKERRTNLKFRIPVTVHKTLREL
jgi:2-polyprenyl-3-methyl-5-hydroxy-6-metoxy-1,4-benzoquinol methylase